MDWTAVIDKVANGYAMEAASDEGELRITSHTVYEEPEAHNEEDGRKAELDTFVKMVWALAEHFAVFYNKHSRYNLKIEVEDSAKTERE